MALPEVGSFEMGVTQRPDVFIFWVQPVLLHLDPCSSPADGPEPDPDPVEKSLFIMGGKMHGTPGFLNRACITSNILAQIMRNVLSFQKLSPTKFEKLRD